METKGQNQIGGFVELGELIGRTVNDHMEVDGRGIFGRWMGAKGENDNKINWDM